MGDFDIRIRLRDLNMVCRHLEEQGWKPKYGMTWKSLVHRSSLRRESWGITRGSADLDLHWRVADGLGEHVLECALWDTAQSFEAFGQRIPVPSPEVTLVYSLNHGFRQGSRADALQTVIDCANLLRDCDKKALAHIVIKSGLKQEFQTLRFVLESSGVSVGLNLESEEFGGSGNISVEPKNKRIMSAVTNSIRRLLPPAFKILHERRSSRVPPDREERALLRYPVLYRAWEAVGRPRLLELMLTRTLGPICRSLEPGRPQRAVYDLRNCEILDEVGGVGWGWPEPEGTCFWSDRADVRLVVPATRNMDYLVVLSFSIYRVISPTPSFAVLANGCYLGDVDFRQTPETSTYVFCIAKSAVFSNWIELSFRPYNYVGDRIAQKNYASRRCLPIQRLEFLRVQDQLCLLLNPIVMPPLYEKIQNGEEPQRSKFDRIKGKIETSELKNSEQLPIGFDPITYVLNYGDLFEAEVDPYEHYLSFGRNEGRLWR
jgi:hypothetical protein